MFKGSTVFLPNNATCGGGIGTAYGTLTFRETANNCEAAQNLTDLQETSSMLESNTSGQNIQASNSSNSSSNSNVVFKKNRGDKYGGAIFT